MERSKLHWSLKQLISYIRMERCIFRVCWYKIRYKNLNVVIVICNKKTFFKKKRIRMKNIVLKSWLYHTFKVIVLYLAVSIPELLDSSFLSHKVGEIQFPKHLKLSLNYTFIVHITHSDHYVVKVNVYQSALASVLRNRQWMSSFPSAMLGTH